jgi:hypothetical protein
MTEREMYLAIAKHLKRYGYDPYWTRYINDDAGPLACGCFSHAAWAILGNPTTGELWRLADIVGSFDAGELRRNGWTAEYQNDAVAACLIAADLAA